ncbi:dTDP-4-dehydrorhamnose 3,5-epimerase family protein [Chachezhania antarctica]|uniref:dTDP-4-dehydrorhamnose 3,5-epimerase family protein n=1 Tax=Chachezhania antarctica TaxID=2340860 RepID=UPI000EAD333E|nr:dTDP-4-dehydrorhamnose 3,5-epimerase family protein [Chachezhania antarctica]|tara:strand:+ start:2297 stop:2866 length:570 start_codon:yes stop_codon:yes gene_type:complete
MSARFDVIDTPLAGLKELRRKRLGDARGYLERMFCADELSALGWLGPVAQANRTLTGEEGTVRGMHYQKGDHAEVKLVTCLSGKVFDVAVDLRDGSPTFGQAHGVVLSPDNANALLIPEGFAHGFQTLTPDCEMFYFHSKFYAPDHEAGLDATDPALGIDWPLPIAMRSDRDRSLPPLAEAQTPGISFS